MKGKLLRPYYIIIMVSMVHALSGAGNGLDQKVHNDYGAVTGTINDYIKDAVVEKVVLYSQDTQDSAKKITRKGILVRYPRARATIIICHGFMCDKFDAGFLRQAFKHGVYNFMAFDFRAHGEDAQGQHCTFGRDEAFEVIAAAQFINHHPDLKNKKKFAYGFSMGAVSAIEAVRKFADSTRATTGSAQQLFDALILDCPFDSSQNVIKRNLDNVKFSFFGYEFNIPGRGILEKYAFHPYVQSLVKLVLKTVAHMDSKNISTYICPIAPVFSVKKVIVPCFFIHCKNDEKVSAQAAQKIFENAGSRYKILWLTNGRHHFDSYFYNPEKYKDMVGTFLRNILEGTVINKSLVRVIEDKEE